MGIGDVLINPWISKFRSENDNRAYNYSEDSVSERLEFDLVEKWIKPKSKVIDLGCGDGTLMKLLEDKKKVDIEGIEISKSGVKACKAKGLKAKVGRIDVKLSYKDNQFDYAVCCATLHLTMYPEVLLKEMKRISKKQIVTFSNFAFLPNRLDLLVNGVMPRIMIPGYKWYSTGHIHQLSIKDFETFCKENNIKIVDKAFDFPSAGIRVFNNFTVKQKWMKKYPNLFANLGVFLTK